MTVTLLRHYTVLHVRRRRCTPHGYLLALREYDTADVRDQKVSLPFEPQRIITSTLRRTEQTLAFLYGAREHERTALLNEVPMAPFTDRDREYDAVFLDVMARMQWMAGSGRQPETRKMTVARARGFMDRYLVDDAHYLLIGHGFFFQTLSRELIRRGFEGRAITFIRNGEHRTFVRDGARA